MKKARAITFLSGREFTAEEIEQVRETVREFGTLSWSELVHTICEHLGWVTPAGRNKFDSCAKALPRLEQEGLLKLPSKRAVRMSPQKVVVGTETDPEGALTGTVRDVTPVQVRPVIEKLEMRLWNSYVQRCHGLGFRQPFGAHQRYFVMGRGAGGWDACCLRRRPGSWQNGTGRSG